MDYISATEAAEKWNIGLRQVQRLLSSGRIPDAKKYGNSWVIPADAEKPRDPRFESKNPEDALLTEIAKIIEATTLPMPFDNPDAILDTVKEERMRLRYESELAYLRGDYERVRECFRKTEGDEASRFLACPSMIGTAISMGDFSLYSEIESYLKSIIQKSTIKSAIAAAELGIATVYVYSMIPQMVPDWLKNGDFTHLHNSTKPFAVYIRARYFHAIGEFESMLNVAETALTFCDLDGGISSNRIWLHILCATACSFLGRVDEAERWLLRAMEIALPHGFISPFAECASVFRGLLEKLLEREYPEFYDPIVNQWKRIIVNWITFHNRVTKDNLALSLSLRNYEIAVMAAKRVPNKEIAEHFHMSQGRLKNKLSEIYSELHVNSRKELENVIFYGKKT